MLDDATEKGRVVGFREGDAMGGKARPSFVAGDALLILREPSAWDWLGRPTSAGNGAG
jgi:hypothetical protein